MTPINWRDEYLNLLISHRILVERVARLESIVMIEDFPAERVDYYNHVERPEDARF